MERNCSICSEPIPTGRLKALPKATTCVKCSNVDAYCGHNMITGKNTYSEVQIVDTNTARKLKEMENRIGYGVSNGVKFDGDKNGEFNGN